MTKGRRPGSPSRPAIGTVAERLAEPPPNVLSRRVLLRHGDEASVITVSDPKPLMLEVAGELRVNWEGDVLRIAAPGKRWWQVWK